MARVSLLSPNALHRHAYCLCLHVRPATIFVACMNLTGSLLCALLTFFFMINKDSKSTDFFISRFARDELNRLNLISVLMYLVLALVSAMLLYGVIKSKPRYILPFFGIQFIDYLFTLPQFFAQITHPYHYYVYKSKNMIDIQDNKAADFDEMRNLWSNSSSSQMYTTSLLILTLIMIFKTYFLCVVWKCYRYLHMTELILPIALNAGGLDPESMMPPSVISRSNVPPPDYEEATKLPDYKPPEYTTVVGSYQNENIMNNHNNNNINNNSNNNNNNPNNNFQTVAIDSPRQTNSKNV